jgi:hypothetical protein
VLDDPRFRAFLTEVARALKTLSAAIEALLASPRPRK